MKVKTFKVSSSYFKNQCYIVYNESSGLLIDPAWDYDIINSFLIDQSISLKGILLTHSHHDHVNLVDQFTEKYNVPVFMSKTEADDYYFSCKNLHTIEHLEVFQLDTIMVKALLTPGHTSGGTCFLVDHHLFTGDTVFIEGIGICDQKGSDVNAMFDSVQFLKSYLLDDTIFWPGHSFGQEPGKSLSFLMENNIYFQLEQRKYFTGFRMRKTQTSPINFK
ncbi:MAG: MBL fold metallo-hydrolase [Fluviicola sp.]|nr:MAG: MBL fold metallo-hydrolase [Fluviicola sp.]